jgi:trigger factor
MKELKAKELPELDDDFAQEVSDQETIAELRASLEKRFQEEAEKETKDSIYEALTKELVKGATLDLPETLIRKGSDANFDPKLHAVSTNGARCQPVVYKR